MLLGLRGVGKTVLLNRLAELAAEERYHVLMLEAPEDRALAEMLVPQLRNLLLKLSQHERTKAKAKAALGVLRAFASVFTASIAGIAFSVAPAVGTADTGILESDLPELLAVVALAAKEEGTGIALLIGNRTAKGGLTA